MSMKMATRLEGFFQHQTDEALRSVVKYEPKSSEIVHLRDDVAEQYTREQLEHGSTTRGWNR